MITAAVQAEGESDDDFVARPLDSAIALKPRRLKLRADVYRLAVRLAGGGGRVQRFACCMLGWVHRQRAPAGPCVERFRAPSVSGCSCGMRSPSSWRPLAAWATARARRRRAPRRMAATVRCCFGCRPAALHPAVGCPCNPACRLPACASCPLCTMPPPCSHRCGLQRRGPHRRPAAAAARRPLPPPRQRARRRRAAMVRCYFGC